VLANLDLSALGWREALLLLILGLVLYMLGLLWRMRRIRRASASERVLREPRVRGPLDDLDAEDDAVADPGVYLRPPSPRPEDRAENGAAMAPAWAPAEAEPLAGRAFMEGVARELEQLREEMDALRGALAALRDDVVDLRADLQQEILAARAAHNTSPLYSEAMQMALQGHEASTIAERCGIARAEAELVVALVKNKDLPT
jgi:hypothetical protein